MLRSERILQNGQGPVIERLGLRPLSPVKVKKGEVIETGGQVGMPGSQALFLDGQGSLIQWLADLQGGQPQRLTTHESSDFSPSWSRDGRWVYFSSNRSGNDQVWKVPAGGGQALQVTQQGGSNPFESPDGTFLYYSKREPNSFWRVPSEGGKETLVLEALELKVHGCAIVNEGIYFAVERSRDPLKPGPGIDFFSFATTEVRPVLAIEKPIWYGLSVSPDGKSILYTQIDHANTDIMLVENFH